MGFDLREKGIPTINHVTCTGCGLCIETCGSQVLVLEDGKVRAGDGIFLGCCACGHCTAVCPTGSITVTGRGMTSEDSCVLPPAFHRASADQLESLLMARRSIRRFEEQEVDRDTIDRILAMTATAPMGLPPSEVGVVVFHGREKVQAFAADACVAFERAARFFSPVMLTLLRPFLGKNDYHTLRRFVGPLLKHLVKKHREGIDEFTYDAPAALLFHYGPMADQSDCQIAATYAMLAVESFGLGSCMLGTTVVLNQDKAFKKKYGIPPRNNFGLGLVIGHPAVKFQRGIRRRLASVRFA